MTSRRAAATIQFYDPGARSFITNLVLFEERVEVMKTLRDDRAEIVSVPAEDRK